MYVRILTMSLFMLILGLAEFLLFIWILLQWRRQPGNIVLGLIAIIAFSVGLDSFLTGFGHWLGFGQTLESLTRFRAVCALFSLSLMPLVCALILRSAGVTWLSFRALLVPLTLLLIAAGLYEAYRVGTADWYRSCVLDVQRYVMKVPSNQACSPDEAGLGAFSMPPVVMLGSFLVLLSGIFLWWRRSWPWLAMSSVALFAALAVPREGYFSFFAYPFDGLLTATLAITAIHFAKSRGSA